MTHDAAVGRARPSRRSTLADSKRHEATARFAFAPDLVLTVTADAATLAHFEAEYAAALDGRPAASAGGPGPAVGHELPGVSAALPGPAVEVAIRTGLFHAGLPAAQPGSSELAVGSALTDGQRTTRWAVRLGDPQERPLRASVSVSGILGRSFVQGFVVEPLLSMAAAREGRMLLPGAGLLLREGLVLVLGRSHSGKTTLAARALAAGRPTLGDDQVILGADGCLPFPRRMRLYPDLARTAPDAFRRLPPSTRLAIRLRGLASLAGMRLPVLATAARPWPSVEDGRRPVPIARVVLVERPAAPGAPDRLERLDLPADRLVEDALRLADEQRHRLRVGADQSWSRELDRTLALERPILATSLGGVPAERIVLPAGWPAERAIAALAAAIGLEP
jgi:hypothetical protein